MNLKAFLLFSATILVWILISKVYMLLYYWGALLALVSFLNSRPKYKQQPYKWVNLVFFVYMLLIVWERTRHYKFAELSELLINDAEHLFFALVISMLIVMMLVTTTKMVFNIKTIAITVVVFNAVGVVNEVFQNLLASRPLFTFIPDSKKDLLMNVFGTIAFIALALLLQKKKPLPQKVHQSAALPA